MTNTQSTIQGWRERFESAGLGALADGLGYALRPLAPLAAQFLWFSQPTFGLFGRAELAEALAEALETPAGSADGLSPEELPMSNRSPRPR